MSDVVLKVPAGGVAAWNATTSAKKLPMIAQWRNAVCARTSTLTSTQRLVALAMALYSDPDGTRCHPSTESLAAATALTTRSVGSALTGIERAGFATRQMMKGRGQAWRWTLWTLCIPEDAEPNSLPRRKGSETGSTPFGEGVETDDTKVRKLVPKGVETRSADLERAPRKSDLEVKAISQPTVGRHDEHFEEVLAAYPRREGKEKARKSYIRQKLDPLAPLIIEKIVERTKGDPGWREKQFIPHLSTYINQRRWEDEWKPATASKPGITASFRDKTYVCTPFEQMAPEYQAAITEAEAAAAAQGRN
jgi:hypothetical protein